MAAYLGYEEFKGQVLDSTDLSSLIEGLRANDLLHYSHMLTGRQLASGSILSTQLMLCIIGYMGAKSFLERVSEIVVEMKKTNKRLIYGKAYLAVQLFVYPCLYAVCDPVLGDNGQLVSDKTD